MELWQERAMNTTNVECDHRSHPGKRALIAIMTNLLYEAHNMAEMFENITVLTNEIFPVDHYRKDNTMSIVPCVFGHFFQNKQRQSRAGCRDMVATNSSWRCNQSCNAHHTVMFDFECIGMKSYGVPVPCAGLHAVSIVYFDHLVRVTLLADASPETTVTCYPMCDRNVEQACTHEI